MEESTIIAYRAWRVTTDGHLMSVACRSYKWLPGITGVAACTKQRDESPPHERSHPCGFHAWKTKGLADKYTKVENRHPPFTIPSIAPPAVMGVVELGGVIWEHDHGWRASRALPLALVQPDDELPQVVTAAERYCIPVLNFQEA